VGGSLLVEGLGSQAPLDPFKPSAGTTNMKLYAFNRTV